MTETSDWIPRIEAAVVALEEKPQFGGPHCFPWNEIQERLKVLLGSGDLTLSHQERGWVATEEIWEGMEENPLALSILFSPLEHPLYFLMSEQDLKTMMLTLFGEKENAAPLVDSAYLDGFYHFLALEVLHQIEELHFAEQWTPRLGESPEKLRESLSRGHCFVVDVSCSLQGKKVWGHLLIPQNFRDTWKSAFAKLPPPPLSKELSNKLPVNLSLEVGEVELALQEWKNAKKGDFIVLDRCMYDPDSKKGRIVVKLGSAPLFRGKFQEGGIKLLEYPFYDEGEKVMDESEELEPLFDDEEELTSEEISSEEVLPEEVSEEASLEAPAPKEAPTISPDNIPVNLTVEVGRVQMTAQELMQLAPGNLLQLPITPEQGVDLLVSGKKVGSGELVKVGETLGVRILHL